VRVVKSRIQVDSLCETVRSLHHSVGLPGSWRQDQQ
jgi:hypothetical protein